MKTISWTRGHATLSAFGRDIPVKNDIRNELNGRRVLGKKSDVVYTESDDKSPTVPYMPRPFPAGSWEVTGVVLHDDPEDHYLNPIFISTSAAQLVEAWSLDASGGYAARTGRFVRDTGYGLHRPDPASTTTTLGCLNILNLVDLLWLAVQILVYKTAGERVFLAVSE